MIPIGQASVSWFFKEMELTKSEPLIQECAILSKSVHSMIWVKGSALRNALIQTSAESLGSNRLSKASLRSQDLSGSYSIQNVRQILLLKAPAQLARSKASGAIVSVPEHSF